MKFRTKPFEIEAIQWTGDNAIQIRRFVGPGNFDSKASKVWDHLQGTWVNVNLNDWIIRGMKDEFYPCADEVFQAKYEYVPYPTIDETIANLDKAIAEVRKYA